MTFGDHHDISHRIIQILKEHVQGYKLTENEHLVT